MATKEVEKGLPTGTREDTRDHHGHATRVASLDEMREANDSVGGMPHGVIGFSCSTTHPRAA
ncbi:hypothetical protein QF035_008915 [Streptomyces umbrinus]|uniref:Uncharacterized protein n=1 Tax=Streptomyces umbrinus TaxID=67370 RepID=A0ABU0T696_9ACTN|nr:hypothetical protein [Streptomyces umbrinus]